MINKRKGNQKRPEGIIISLLILTVFLYLLVTFIGLQTDIKEKKVEIDVLSSQYQQQLAQNDELQKLIDKGDEAQYIEHIAREQRNYVYPDERVYFDITPGSY
ncbi:MAG: Cell division protein FtsL [Firmicutes bacterium ADurb.Bin300]|nr:MAG: Cell division protein FtsL [Firmicutes bacterium ADurb.Bin300]